MVQLRRCIDTPSARSKALPHCVGNENENTEVAVSIADDSIDAESIERLAEIYSRDASTSEHVDQGSKVQISNATSAEEHEPHQNSKSVEMVETENSLRKRN